jgi:GT2 family glycosyltransferase
MLPNLIVPVLNRYDLLQDMLNSIDEPVGDLLIIDNGGSADSLSFPGLAERVHFIQLPSNLGVAASWNLGIKLLPHHDRWFFASNDMQFMPGGMKTLAEARRDELTLTQDAPYWQCFAVGDTVVEEVGLWDEGFYPAYFEDNDYHRRVETAGYEVRKLPIKSTHQNSSTIRSNPDLLRKNDVTFAYNRHYYKGKIDSGDYSEGGWKLHRRREASWDRPR